MQKAREVHELSEGMRLIKEQKETREHALSARVQQSDARRKLETSTLKARLVHLRELQRLAHGGHDDAARQELFLDSLKVTGRQESAYFRGDLPDPDAPSPPPQPMVITTNDGSRITLSPPPLAYDFHVGADLSKVPTSASGGADALYTPAPPLPRPATKRAKSPSTTPSQFTGPPTKASSAGGSSSSRSAPAPPSSRSACCSSRATIGGMPLGSSAIKK